MIAGPDSHIVNDVGTINWKRVVSTLLQCFAGLEASEGERMTTKTTTTTMTMTSVKVTICGLGQILLVRLTIRKRVKVKIPMFESS